MIDPRFYELTDVEREALHVAPGNEINGQCVKLLENMRKLMNALFHEYVMYAEADELFALKKGFALLEIMVEHAHTKNVARLKVRR